MTTEDDRPIFCYQTPHLVVDIGNTGIACGFFCGEELKSRTRLDPRSSWAEELVAFLRDNAEVSYALIASVNQGLNRKLSEVLRRFEVAHSFVGDHELALSTKAAEPEKVGADRLADVYGALKLHPGNSIIISCGTAIAINVVDKDGVFVGGLIYPGMEMSARALSQQTDLLPFVTIDKPPTCSSVTTEGNIRAGIYYGLLGAIGEFIRRIDCEHFKGLSRTVIATGGLTYPDEEGALAHHLQEDLLQLVDALEPDLTLVGLNEIFRELEQQSTNVKDSTEK